MKERERSLSHEREREKENDRQRKDVEGKREDIRISNVLLRTSICI